MKVSDKKIAIILIIFLNASYLLLAGPRQSGQVKAHLISEVLSIKPGRTFCVGLQLLMDDHWHTYWKNPGDSGLPTKIVWQLPDGFVAGDIQWPCPQKFVLPEVVNFGYEGEVLLITPIAAPNALESGSKVKLAASVDWLACKEGCIPGHADLQIELPVKTEDPKTNKRWIHHFEKARIDLPEAAPDWKIDAFMNEDKIFIKMMPPLWFKRELVKVTFFPEQEELINYSGFQGLKRSSEWYILEIQKSKLSTMIPLRLKGVLFSKEGWSKNRQEHALQVDVPFHTN
jgi:DsbC/DsbD-like thiol-disulfide interchange protein